MNVRGIRRSGDWPFPMPEFTANAIDELVDAWERDDRDIDCYMDEVEGCARGVSPERDRQIYEYYLMGGYRSDVID